MNVVNNRYQIISCINNGDMTGIYLAKDKLRNNHVVVLKKYDPSIVDYDKLPSCKQQFEVIHKIKHPNLVHLYDFDRDNDDDTFFITVKYDKKLQPLAGLMRGESIVDYDLPLIFIDICRALHFLHTRKIIHHALQTDTIMYRNNTVMLIDYGISRLFTRDVVIRNNIRYCAPEVLENNAGTKADIFSAGIVFYELLTGNRFYADLTDDEVQSVIKNEDTFSAYKKKVLDMSAKSPLIPIIDKMTHYKPAMRYQSCREIIIHINEYYNKIYTIESPETMRAYMSGIGFVCREKELVFLKDYYRLVSPENNAVYIRGRTGVGKNSLLREFELYCRSHEIPFFHGDCGDKQFLGPFIPILKELLTTVDDSLISRFGGVLKRVLPYHGRLTQVKQVAYQCPKVEQVILEKTVARFIIEGVEYNQMKSIIYLQDVHLAGPRILAILDRVLDAITGTEKLAVYLTGCNEDVGIKNITNLYLIDLEPFTTRCVEKYIAAAFGEDEIGAVLMETYPIIVEKTAGTPYFIRELIKSFVDNGLIHYNDSAWELMVSPDNIRWPRRTEDIIKERIKALGLNSNDKSVLHIMALLNRKVGYHDLNWIIAFDFNLLQRLIDEGVIQEVLDCNKIDYVIAHESIIHVIESQIVNKKQLHGDIAFELENIYSDKPSLLMEEPAYHYFEYGSNTLKTIKYLMKIGDRAAQYNDNAIALEYYETVLPLIKSDNIILKVDVMIKKAKIYELMGQYETSINLYNDVISPITGLNDKSILISAYIGLGTVLEKTDNTAYLACETFEKALELCDAIHDNKRMCEVLYCLSEHYRYTDHTKALTFLERGSALAGDLKDRYLMGCFYESLAGINSQSGDLYRTIEYQKKAVTFFDERNDRCKLLMVYYNMAFYYRNIEDYVASLMFFDKAFIIAQEIEEYSIGILSLFGKIITLLDRDNTEDARHTYEYLIQYRENCDGEMGIILEKIIGAKIALLDGHKEKAKMILNRMLENGENVIHYSPLTENNYELWKITHDDRYRMASLTKHEEILTERYNYLITIRIKELAMSKPINRDRHFERKSPVNQPVDFFKKHLQTSDKEHPPISDKLFDKEFLTENIGRISFLKELFIVIRDLNSNVSLNDILVKLLDACIYFLNAHRGAILLYDDYDQLVIQTARNCYKEEISDMRVATTAIDKVLHDMTPIFIPDLLENEDLISSQSILDLELQSIMCAPLENKINREESKVIGIIYLDSKSTTSEEGLTGNNLELLQTIADQAVVAINNALINERLEELVKERTIELHRAMDNLKIANEELTKARDALWGEMELAKKIQTLLLPDAPKIKGYQVAGHLTPIDLVGGDYYDVINTNGRDWLVIGDVAGHGVAAGLVMMMAQTSIHTALNENPQLPPSRLLMVVNKVLTNNLKKFHDLRYMTITVLACHENGSFQFSGLHLDIMIYRADTSEVETVMTDGIWLGIKEDIAGIAKDREIVLNIGDIMLLYTDGLTEAIKNETVGKTNEMFSRDKLLALLKAMGTNTPNEIKDEIIKSLKDYTCFDDVTLLILKREE